MLVVMHVRGKQKLKGGGEFQSAKSANFLGRLLVCVLFYFLITVNTIYALDIRTIYYNYTDTTYLDRATYNFIFPGKNGGGGISVQINSQNYDYDGGINGFVPQYFTRPLGGNSATNITDNVEAIAFAMDGKILVDHKFNVTNTTNITQFSIGLNYLTDFGDVSSTGVVAIRLNKDYSNNTYQDWGYEGSGSNVLGFGLYNNTINLSVYVIFDSSRFVNVTEGTAKINPHYTQLEMNFNPNNATPPIGAVFRIPYLHRYVYGKSLDETINMMKADARDFTTNNSMSTQSSFVQFSGGKGYTINANYSNVSFNFTNSSYIALVFNNIPAGSIRVRNSDGNTTYIADSIYNSLSTVRTATFYANWTANRMYYFENTSIENFYFRIQKTDGSNIQRINFENKYLMGGFITWRSPSLDDNIRTRINPMYDLRSANLIDTRYSSMHFDGIKPISTDWISTYFWTLNLYNVDKYGIIVANMTYHNHTLQWYTIIPNDTPFIISTMRVINNNTNLTNVEASAMDYPGHLENYNYSWIANITIPGQTITNMSSTSAYAYTRPWNGVYGNTSSTQAERAYIALAINQSRTSYYTGSFLRPDFLSGTNIIPTGSDMVGTWVHAPGLDLPANMELSFGGISTGWFNDLSEADTFYDQFKWLQDFQYSNGKLAFGYNVTFLNFSQTNNSLIFGVRNTPATYNATDSMIVIFNSTKPFFGLNKQWMNRIYYNGNNISVNGSLDVNGSDILTQQEAYLFPSSNFIDMVISSWNTTYKLWNESSSNPSTVTNHTIGDFPANAQIVIKKNGAYWNTFTSNASGYINFTYSEGYSNIQFEALQDTTPPTVSLSLSTSSVYQGSAITISCSASDNYQVSSTSLIVTKPTGTATGTCGQAFTDTIVTGVYTVTYSATDTSGNSASTSQSFTVNQLGGSSSGTQEATQTITATSGDAAEKITVNLNTQISGASVSVAKLTGVPASIPSITETTYQYLNITKTNFNNSQISNVSIDFKVSKSWIEENNITNISLARYENGWSKLKTELVNSTSDFNSYRAYTNGFSYFAIVGEKAQVSQSVEPAKNITGQQANETENPNKPEFLQYLFYAGVAVVLIIIVYFAKFRKRKKKYGKAKKKR